MTHSPRDTPPVDRLLAALRQPPLADETAGEPDAVALIASRIREATLADLPRRTPMPARRPRLALTAALAAAGLVACSGLAYAGDLPGAAQSKASDMLSKLGVSVPGPNEHGKAHPHTRGASATHPAPAADDSASEQPAEAADEPGGDSGSGSEGTAHAGKGEAVSTLAHTTTLTGRDKGAAVSALASGRKSHAGNPPGQSKHDGDTPRSHPTHPAHPDHHAQPAGAGGSGDPAGGRPDGAGKP